MSSRNDCTIYHQVYTFETYSSTTWAGISIMDVCKQQGTPDRYKDNLPIFNSATSANGRRAELLNILKLKSKQIHTYYNILEVIFNMIYYYINWWQAYTITVTTNNSRLTRAVVHTWTKPLYRRADTTPGSQNISSSSMTWIMTIAPNMYKCSSGLAQTGSLSGVGDIYN